MISEPTGRWMPIRPVPAVNGSVTPLLATVDSLRAAWTEAVAYSTPEEFEAAQAKRLRRHAVETGIIERLYELDWGVTELLVAEGLSAEVASRAGGVSEDTLSTIRSQYDALEYLVELAREGRDISVQIIRELHQIITRNQITYEARDQFGRVIHKPLRHGEWKQQINRVVRQDGTTLDFTPPEHVQSEIEQLIEYYLASTSAHPIVRAAWLHHSFVRVHPFEDGNGRVARALTLLILLRDRYAPLVVDRRERETYIQALDAANDGDLAELVRMFAKLEIIAMQSTLTQPISFEREGHASSVVQSYARRLHDLRDAAAVVKRQAVNQLAAETHAGVLGYLDGEATSLKAPLREVDGTANVWVTHAQPPDERARYYRRQLITAANSVDFYTNLAEGSWWVSLVLDALGERLRYLAAVQKVGHGETGVLALTAYAELVRPESDEASVAVEPQPALELSPTDCVTMAYTDHFADRHDEIEHFLRDTLRRAVERFVLRLG
jgi:prophage maintenance system killer protein